MQSTPQKTVLPLALFGSTNQNRTTDRTSKRASPRPPPTDRSERPASQTTPRKRHLPASSRKEEGQHRPPRPPAKRRDGGGAKVAAHTKEKEQNKKRDAIASFQLLPGVHTPFDMHRKWNTSARKGRREQSKVHSQGSAPKMGLPSPALLMPCFSSSRTLQASNSCTHAPMHNRHLWASVLSSGFLSHRRRRWRRKLPT